MLCSFCVFVAIVCTVVCLTPLGAQPPILTNISLFKLWLFNGWCWNLLCKHIPREGGGLPRRRTDSLWCIARYRKYPPPLVFVLLFSRETKVMRQYGVVRCLTLQVSWITAKHDLNCKTVPFPGGFGFYLKKSVLC